MKRAGGFVIVVRYC